MASIVADSRTMTVASMSRLAAGAPDLGGVENNGIDRGIGATFAKVIRRRARHG